MIYRKLTLIKNNFTKYLSSATTYFKGYKRLTVFLITALFVILVSFYISIVRAPSQFPVDYIINIDEGDTISSVAIKLKEENIVKSSVWARNLMVILGGKKGILSGGYFFQDAENVFSVVWRITRGDYNLDYVKVVIPEGATIFQIADILDVKLSSFNKEEFLKLTKDKEGYLFPDTYFFLSSTDEKDIVRKLNDNFDKKLAEIKVEVENFDKPIEDIIKMASILEKEARTTEARRTIAGILWERIRIGMPLQVDAVFGYENVGKNSFTLTLDDLRNDNPYNTYTNKELPPTPIANPGLDSIRATINPIESNYLFFLSDMEGNMHYSETFEEHKEKKSIYLY